MIFTVDEESRHVARLSERTFSELDVLERTDLQEWIIEEPKILGKDLLIVTSEYSGFRDTQDRLDLLAIDRSGELVVIELKRDEADRTTDLQAIKYASYCSTLTAKDLQQEYREFHAGRSEQKLSTDEVGKTFAEFLTEYPNEIVVSEEGWADFQIDNRPRILLAAGSFGTELTSPVMWLIQEYNMDISCVKIDAYREDGQILLNSRRIIPVPEVEEYMTKRRKKEESQTDREPWNGKDFYVSFGEGQHRNWEDARKYGFVSGGQGEWHSRTLGSLEKGKRVFVHIPTEGYVGYGIIRSEKTPVTEFQVEHDSETKNILDVPLNATAMDENAGNKNEQEYLIGIDWEETRSRENAFWNTGMFANQNTACRFRDQDTLEQLYDEFGIEQDPKPEEKFRIM
jgi:hypothetical protein